MSYKNFNLNRFINMIVLNWEMGYEAFNDGVKRDIHQSNEWLAGWDAAQDEAEQSSYYKL